MKRRHFVKKFGTGLSSSVFIPDLLQVKTSPGDQFEYQYPVPAGLENARNEEGLIVLRIELTGESADIGARINGRFRMRKVKAVRMQPFFKCSKNTIDPTDYRFDLSVMQGDQHIMTLWLDEVTEASEIIVLPNDQRIRIAIRDFFPVNQFEEKLDSYSVKANLLFHHELGSVNPMDHGIGDQGKNFRFIIMADPQGGDPYYDQAGSNARIKIHNAFIEESIMTANMLDPRPAFALILGDFTDRQGEEENFRNMMRLYETLDMPMLLEIGNHETRYRSEFTPGYNMSAFRNYFAAQRTINGMEKLAYSFDLGNWHFIVWPDPLRDNFWETHPHYFDWLVRDLEQNRDVPTFFFQHVPMHPIGINPLVSYVNPVNVNRLLYEILSKNGNVKYVFSGHVHIPLKSSLKTAVTFRGTHFINLPATGYRPRAFGEEDLYGGPSQGFCIVDVSGEKATVSFKTVTHEVLNYPEKFRDYNAESDPLWFNDKWEVTPGEGLVNGSFEAGLAGWMRKYVYPEDEHPSNVCEVRDAPDRSGKALYLYIRRRDYDKPGQDRMPQTLNQLTQIIGIREGRIPVIHFQYRVDHEHFDPKSWNGAFLWVEGYHEDHLMVNHVYSIGKAHRSVGGSYRNSAFTGYSFFNIYDSDPGWNDVRINLESDYDTLSHEYRFHDLHLDRLVLNFGVWSINKGYRQEAAAYFTNVSVEQADGANPDAVDPSHVNARTYSRLDQAMIWNRGMNHLAGEHNYVRQEEIYPF